MAKAKVKADAEGHEKFEVVDGFELVNSDKLKRVVYGDVGAAGVPEGGVGEDAEPNQVLALYDKIGGLITKDGVKIKTGSFWDTRKKAPREKPQVTYIYMIGGESIEVDDPKNLAQAVQTVNDALRSKEEKVARKKAASKFQENKVE